MEVSLNPGVPGTPAVAAVAEIPATITITVSLEQAAVIALLCGVTNGNRTTNPVCGVYNYITDVLKRQPGGHELVKNTADRVQRVIRAHREHSATLDFHNIS